MALGLLQRTERDNNDPRHWVAARDDADVCSKLNQKNQLYLGHSVSHGATNTLPALHTPFISSGARQCYQNNLDVQWLGTAAAC